MDLGPESSKMLSSLDFLRYLRRRPQLARRDVAHRLVDLHVRLAMPWACLIVTIFGIPAGSRYSRQSALSGVFLAIGFFMAFYALVQFAILLGKWQVLEPWLAAWLPNLVFLLAGAAMLWRMR
jgi:lipopolysaccharide export LptBFGC system permease protein LptF